MKIAKILLVFFILWAAILTWQNCWSKNHPPQPLQKVHAELV